MALDVMAPRAWGWLPVVAVLLVAPLLVGGALLDPGRRVAGLPGDPSSAVWQLGEMGTGRLGLVSPTTTPSANAPSGARLRRPIEVSTAAFDVVALGFVRLMGPVAAYNWLLVLAVVTNGLAMVYLGRRLRFGPFAQTAAAVAFAASPVLLVELQLHVALSFAFTIPLVAAYAMRVVEEPGVAPAIAAGALTGASAYVNPYLPLYTATLLGVFLVVATAQRGKRALGSAAAAIATAAVVALPAALVILLNRGSVVDETRRTIEEVGLYSLGALDYLRSFGVRGGLPSLCSSSHSSACSRFGARRARGLRSS